MVTNETTLLESIRQPAGSPRRKTSLGKEILHQLDAGQTALARFMRGYVDAALGTSRDDTGAPLDRDHAITDVAPEALIAAWVECSQFCRECAWHLSHLDDGHDGRNFWFARNHHGFWDGPSGDESAEFAAQQLTRAGESFGEVDLYIGADRKLHFSNEGSFA
jgi:hypothetical protein